MKTEWLKNTIDEYESAGNKIYGFYVTYKETENTTIQKWGHIYEFGEILSEMEKNGMCARGELPIERLIVYADEQCLVFVENPLWDCANMDSEYSHATVAVPYIAEDGWFGKIIPERETSE